MLNEKMGEINNTIIKKLPWIQCELNRRVY